MSIFVLYEDNHIIVVDKPVNMPVQEDSSKDEDLLSCVKSYVKEKYNKPGKVYIGLVHRLDRPVGGVMVFARTSKAAARLSSQMQSCSAVREYVAITDQAVSSSQTLEDYLLKDPQTNTVKIVPSHLGKLAKLEYCCVASKQGKSLLKVRLHTGRSHQIRVQLAHAQMPIECDQKYNPNAILGDICLYAFRLCIIHPTKQEQMCFMKMPYAKQWQLFSDELAQMERTQSQ